jgi:hypothetical protein
MQVKPDKPPPPYIKLGAGAHYTRLDVLANLLGSTEKSVRSLVGLLEIPLVHFPGTSDSRYILTYAFESALFGLGMPKKIKERPDLLRVHQELAGILYGTLTMDALKKRVLLLTKTLTSAGDDAIIGKRKKRTRKDHSTWSGRKLSG